MARVKRGTQHVKRRKNLLAKKKGMMWGRKSKIRIARPAMLKAGVNAYRDRRNKKRSFRRLWQIRLNAAVRPLGLSYSRFIDGLKKANIILDRKKLLKNKVKTPKRAFFSYTIIDKKQKKPYYLSSTIKSNCSFYGYNHQTKGVENRPLYWVSKGKLMWNKQSGNHVVDYSGEESSLFDIAAYLGDEITAETVRRPSTALSLTTSPKTVVDPNYEFLETGTWNTPTELFGGQQEQASKETTILEEIERIEDLVPPVRRTLKLVEVGDGKFETPPSTREYPEKEVPSRSIVSMRHEANVLAELLSMRDVQQEELDRERDRLMLALEKGTWTYNPKEENVDKMFEETIPSKDDLRETVLLEIVSSDDVSTSEEDEDVLLLEEVEEQPPPLPDDEGDEEVVEK